MKRRVATNGLLLTVTALVAFDIGQRNSSKADAPAHSELVLGDPSLSTCPTANCPAPPAKPVLSTQFIHGSTTKGAEQPEWLSNIGFFVKTGAPNGQKVAQYIGVMQAQGAGSAWALNTDLVRNAGIGGPNSFGGFEGSGKGGKPGAIGDANGSIGYELDFTNWDTDSSAGHGPFTVGQYVHAQGSYTSLSAFYLDAAMAPGSIAWQSGIAFTGANLIRQNTVADYTNAPTTLAIGGHHDHGLSATQANANMEVVAMREGQTVCFNSGQSCITYRGGRLLYLNSKRLPVFSVDDQGNAAFSGRVSEDVKIP